MRIVVASSVTHAGSTTYEGAAGATIVTAVSPSEQTAAANLNAKKNRVLR